ncbi:MAG: SGNH/GDSL hydrolase family protein [Acidobacteria bacterium]|nr:SGNH/GDSL hydrolase family protein [Acidobacteriota bacterium]
MHALRKLALLLCLGSIAVQAQKPSRPYDQLFVFGDSYSDTGAGYIDGNGPTAVWYMAKDLGIDLVIPLKSWARASVNFAVSGARTDGGLGRIDKHGEILGYGMQLQIGQFRELMQAGLVTFDPKRTMFFFAGGLNDRTLPIETSAQDIEDEIETLYGLGARRFMVAILPEKIPQFAQQGIRVNPALRGIPEEMKRRHADIEIATSNWGAFLDEVITNPAKYGITNTTDRCAGRVLHNEDPTRCATPEKYFFYHEGHPSTRAHEVAGGMLADEAKKVSAH